MPYGVVGTKGVEKTDPILRLRLGMEMVTLLRHVMLGLRVSVTGTRNVPISLFAGK